MMWLLLSLTTLATASAVSFNLSNVFSSHGVFQRGKANTVWGWATAADVIVSATWIDSQAYSGTSDASGLWRLVFPAAAAVATPFNVSFTAAGAPTLTLSDLLVGDVFVCAGQSNMGAVQVAAMQNASDMVAAAAAFPNLRLFQVDGNTQSPSPLAQWPTDALDPWQPPLLNGNSTLLSFSAACYIMGSTLYAEYLKAVPVGLIHSSHGGTSIQAWISPAAVDACGDNSNSWNSSVLYNSNLHPLTVGPAAIA